jgi:hypothetical protein
MVRKGQSPGTSVIFAPAVSCRILFRGRNGTRIPEATLAFAGIFLLLAIGYFTVGASNVRKLMNWWLDRLEWFALPYCLIAIAMGVFLMWLAWPTSPANGLAG